MKGEDDEENDEGAKPEVELKKIIEDLGIKLGSKLEKIEKDQGDMGQRLEKIYLNQVILARKVKKLGEKDEDDDESD